MARGLFAPELVAKGWFSPDALAKGWFDEDLIDSLAAGNASAIAANGSATVDAAGAAVAETTATSADGAATVSGVGSSVSGGESSAVPADGVSTVSAAAASTAEASATSADGLATVSGVGYSFDGGSTTAVPAAGAASVSAAGSGGQPTETFSGGYPGTYTKSKKDKRRERIDLGILPPDPVEAPAASTAIEREAEKAYERLIQRAKAEPPELPKPAPKPPTPARVDVSPAAAAWVDGWAREYNVNLPSQAYRQLLQLGASAIAGVPRSSVEPYIDPDALEAFVNIKRRQREEDEFLLLMS